MAEPAEERLWKIAESDEVEIETRREEKSPAHRTTIWIVPTKDGIYVRSVNGARGRWYQEAMANPTVTVYRGREHVRARVEPEKNSKIIQEVSDAYRTKYGVRWADDTESMLRQNVLHTTLRLNAAGRD